MNGIDILNKEEILVAPEWILNVVIVSIIVFIISLFFACLFTEFSMDIASDICVIFLVLSGISVIVFYICDVSLKIEPTGRYRYEATIDNSVSINEVYEKYNVIEQRGDIWVLEDKED